MLSILSRIKNRISNIITKSLLLPKARTYHIVVDESIMTVNPNNTLNIDEEGGRKDDELIPPPPSPVVTTTLFNTEIDKEIIKNDYELQDLLRIMKLYRFDVSKARLESRFETIVNAIPNASMIDKIKMKILYIIIANDIYRNIFEEKKQYHSIKIKQYVGVFRYNDYIIRIDDCPFSFLNETEVTNTISKLKDDHPHIIRPFLIYTNIRRNCITDETCECQKPKCDCIYIDNAENEFLNTDRTNEDDEDDISFDLAQSCFQKLRNNTISFSIQHYVKDTVSLYTWVKDNLATDVYNRFTAIQRTFFIELFYKCALLLRDIHSVSIVHGDIKPDNILIREHTNFNINHPERCKNFTVYLIDFGLSGFDKIGIGTGGTVPYCHPEFKNITDTHRTSRYNWKTMDVKHDVWSLGLSFLTIYIYHDFYSYYHKYPNYFFLKTGYVSSLIIDVITDTKINELFTKMLSEDCISSNDVTRLLKEMR